MRLDPEQERSLREVGFARLPGAVPANLVESALRVINHRLGEGMSPELLPTFRAQSYFPELKGEPAITDLFYRSPLHALADSVFGAGGLEPVKGGQIAIRFPMLERAPGPRGHIDGIPTATNGVAPGSVASFTALMAVFLTPLRQAEAGNFTVWPGSHRRMAEYFREHRADELPSGMPHFDYGAPEPILAEPGDALLAHYMLIHGAAINMTPFPRYAVFFRLKHVAHKPWPDPRFSLLWSEWHGLGAGQ
jgi:hypothetical protein